MEYFMQYCLKLYTQKMEKANIDYFYHIDWQKITPVPAES